MTIAIQINNVSEIQVIPKETRVSDHPFPRRTAGIDDKGIFVSLFEYNL
jgi:hypothetical protein